MKMWFVMYDAIVIGAGPAGLTAGIYLARGGAKTLIIEKESIGGQIASSPLVENYPGYKSISGSELTDMFYDQVVNLGVDIEIGEVKSIEDRKIKKVFVDDNVYETKTIIIATGVKHRKLNLENEDDFIGSGIHFCATCDGTFYKNKDVAVVGGANSAVINAIYLSSLCNKVYLIYRGEDLKCEKKLKEKVLNLQNVEILLNSNVIKYLGVDKLEKIVVKDTICEKEIKVDGLFLSIGMDPETSIKLNLNKTDNNYYDSVDTLTNLPGIFVAGDCRNKEVRQVTTAVSDGTIAAINALNYLKN